MYAERTVRHALLLLLFLLFIVLGCLVANPLDSNGGAYDEDMRDLRGDAGGVSLLRALWHSPSYWRRIPLTMNREEFPHLTDVFIREYLNRTTPPQLTDVQEARTLLSSDFFEELQLWRRPSDAATQTLRLLQAQTEHDRQVARVVAVQNRNKKPWKTRKAPSRWPFPSLRLFTGSSASSGTADVGDSTVAAQTAFTPPVLARYDSEVLYCGMHGLHNAPHRRASCGSSDSAIHRLNKTADTTQGNSSGVEHRLVSLETDEVQLVPYPFVPTVYREPAAAEEAETQESTIHPPQQPQQSVIRIDRGKLRCAVPQRAQAHTPTHGWDHFFLALNLWKNEAVLPDLTEALMAFLTEEIQPFFDLATAVVVSIYANISPDRTAELIESILIPRLHAAGVRTVYATTEGSCLGYVERQPFHERIEWMACVRNKALGPLFEYGMSVFDGTKKERTRATSTTVDPRPSEGEADGLVVLFFNDIFFRPQDIVSLLESHAAVQMESATRPHGWLASLTRQSSVAADRTAAAGATDADVQKMQDGTTTARTTASPHRSGTTFDMACGMDFYYTFYDTWVTRDRLGNPFEAQMPYSDDHVTQEAFYRILNHDITSAKQQQQKQQQGTAPVTVDGRVQQRGAATRREHQTPAPEAAAVPVKCCWNGVAAIRGRFFLEPSVAHRREFLSAADTDAKVAGREAATVVSPVVFVNQRQAVDTRDRSEDQAPTLPSAAAAPPATVQRLSGALYDRVGSTDVLLHRTGLASYYTRVLTRRLQSMRTAWNTTRREIAELTGTPFYRPTVYDNSSSFLALLRAVQDGQRAESAETGKDAERLPWFQLSRWLDHGGQARLRFNGSWAVFLAGIDRLEQQQAPQQNEVHASQDPALGTTSTTLRMTEADVPSTEESAYYVARHPALRFRHAFTPSYGATVAGRPPVRDDVCLSSECMLICQDVMQAAILRDGRAPVILLNPHVRVAYDLEHFQRVTTHTWFFEHPHVYWVWVLARRAQLWWTTGSTSGLARSLDAQRTAAATSATDDWMRPNSTAGTLKEPSMHRLSSYSPYTPVYTQHELNLEDGYGNVLATGLVDIPTLTRMVCQQITIGTVGHVAGAFFPLFRFTQLLLVVVLLRWLCWQIQADVSSGGGSSSRDPSVEERWWRALYQALWHSRVPRAIRVWVDSLSAEDAHYAVHKSESYTVSGGGSSGSGNRHSDRHNGSGSFLPATPLLHLQLRQYYRRKKLAASLGTCADSVKRALRPVARVTLWVLGSLGCVRFWCGCRLPGPPPAPLAVAHTRGGRLWNQFVFGTTETMPHRDGVGNSGSAVARNGRYRSGWYTDDTRYTGSFVPPTPFPSRAYSPTLSSPNVPTSAFSPYGRPLPHARSTEDCSPYTPLCQSPGAYTVDPGVFRATPSGGNGDGGEMERWSSAPPPSPLNVLPHAPRTILSAPHAVHAPMTSYTGNSSNNHNASSHRPLPPPAHDGAAAWLSPPSLGLRKETPAVVLHARTDSGYSSANALQGLRPRNNPLMRGSAATAATATTPSGGPYPMRSPTTPMVLAPYEGAGLGDDDSASTEIARVNGDV